MKKIFFILLLFLSGILATNGQSSLTLNYLYLGGREKRTADISRGTTDYSDKVSKSLASNGIGIQGRINLKNEMIIMPDIGYFFEDYEKLNITGTLLKNAYRENKLKCIAANINIGYTILPRKSSSLIFFAGAGYFHEIIWSYFFSEGEIQHNIPGFISKYDINDEAKTWVGTIVLNMGLDWKLNLSKKIFANVGLKYMFDIFDTRYNGFPYINTGIGYSF